MRPRTSSRAAARAPGRFDVLADELERRFGAGDALQPWSEETFSALALEAFAHQLASNRAFRALCEARGVGPGTISDWRDVPLVPATAFKHLELVSVDEADAAGLGVGAAGPDGGAVGLHGAGPGGGSVGLHGAGPDGGVVGPPAAAAAARAAAVFRTSGTTAGAARRGRHFVPRLSLYRASLLPPFRAYLLPDVDRVPFVSLVPHPSELPDSSLSYMIGAAAEAFASEAHWVVDGRGRLDEPGLRKLLARLSGAGRPCLLLGTTLALWRLAERLESQPSPPLPEGSRVMQTGGFKGSGRAVAPAAVRARLARALGVPERRVVGEYGMTELLSQLYTPVLREAEGPAAAPRDPAHGPRARGAEDAEGYVPPPWLRVRALDPVTLEELPPGEDGLLAFFDLANVGSVCHVLTEDVGAVMLDGHVRLAGRAVGAEPRGCSRAMDELMAAAEGRG